MKRCYVMISALLLCSTSSFLVAQEQQKPEIQEVIAVCNCNPCRCGESCKCGVHLQSQEEVACVECQQEACEA